MASQRQLVAFVLVLCTSTTLSSTTKHPPNSIYDDIIKSKMEEISSGIRISTPRVSVKSSATDLSTFDSKVGKGDFNKHLGLLESKKFLSEDHRYT